MKTLKPVRIEVEFDNGFIAECLGEAAEKYCQDQGLTFNDPFVAVKSAKTGLTVFWNRLEKLGTESTPLLTTSTWRIKRTPYAS